MPLKKSPSKRRPRTPQAEPAAVFEKLLKDTAAVQHYRLRLYITGTTLRSIQAVTNIRSLCEELLPGRYTLEVIDIYQQPEEAAKGQIIAAPTLIKELPVPLKRLIGDLSDRDKIMVALSLADPGAGRKAVPEPKQVNV